MLEVKKEYYGKFRRRGLKRLRGKKKIEYESGEEGKKGPDLRGREEGMASICYHGEESTRPLAFFLLNTGASCPLGARREKID